MLSQHSRSHAREAVVKPLLVEPCPQGRRRASARRAVPARPTSSHRSRSRAREVVVGPSFAEPCPRGRRRAIARRAAHARPSLSQRSQDSAREADVEPSLAEPLPSRRRGSSHGASCPPPVVDCCVHPTASLQIHRVQRPQSRDAVRRRRPLAGCRFGHPRAQ